jgi:hypothetical protein
MSAALSSHRTHVAPFRASTMARCVSLLLLLYTVYAVLQLNFDWPRFISGLDRGARLLGKMFPPDLSKGDILWNGMIESMQMAVLASVLGIVISLPLGLLGARNLMPQPVTWVARAVVAACRSLHPGDRRDRVCQGGWLWSDGGHSGVDGGLDWFHRQAVCRGDRGNFGQTSRGSACHRRLVCERDLVWRAATRCCRALWDLQPTSSTPTCATPPWWASWARAASVGPCSQPFSVLTIPLSSPFWPPS